MQAQVEELRPYLHSFDFQNLLVEGLGWDYYQTEPLPILVNNRRYSLKPVAEKAGFVVYECDSSDDNNIPQYPVRRKIQNEVAKRTFEHLIIFTDPGRTTQLWQWANREPGKPNVFRQIAFSAGQNGDHLLQPLRELAFTLGDEVTGIGITEVTSRVRAALDVEKVTRQFYERFRTELVAFQGFIDGITAQGDREWYASLMLNRMMFVYFVQKQGFLDGDVDYLQNRLRSVQSRRGSGRFQDFYREFLLRLFHEGLGQPELERDPELADLLGQIPFLNGGLFDVHDLERDNPDISIPDGAFERVFSFFDGYRWHLDERPRREDNEINPDVLGYIFEKYVNQKQMGAYYTKEDITGYITRNTVIPFLFDAAKKECPVAFRAGGGVWRLLQDDPDRYIYPAVGHGMAWSYSTDADPVRLEQALELPEDIAAGLDDVSHRGGWNRPAPGDYALPTETWREVVARRRRYQEVRDKLAAGEVSDVNDLITLNLDIEQFALDVIVQSEGPELLRGFWHALRDVSVLDPTCGSGAFLFAALNILEPLYTACLEGMRGFLDDLERTQRPRHQQTMSDFRDILKQADRHPSQRYFILKSIVLNNLYGVDIMEEAVEICKLRLFLKLVAQLESYDQIEPLPDIDFNIKAGNTLVGFTSLDAVRQAMTITPGGQLRALDAEQQKTLDRIEADAGAANEIYDHFRRYQITPDSELDSILKQQIKDGLGSLRTRLDGYQASQYGINQDGGAAYAIWVENHQPFHWFVEFYGIMSKGGFDVVIGNPPYVSTKKIAYALPVGLKESFSDIYGHVLVQALALTRNGGRSSMILPLSVAFSRDFGSLRMIVCAWGNSWFSSFDNIPAALFTGVSQRCTIWIGHNSENGAYVAPIHRWRSAGRPHLMESLAYVSIKEFDVGTFGLPKLGSISQRKVLARLSSPRTERQRSILPGVATSGSQIGYSQAARNFISVFRSEPPCLDASSLKSLTPSKIGTLNLSRDDDTFAALAALSGELGFWYWLVRGDGFDVTGWLVRDYLELMNFVPPEHYGYLVDLGRILHEERNRWLVFKKNAGRYVGNFNYRGAYQLTRRADLLVLDGMSLDKDEAVEMFEYVQRVLAINEQAGEKGIPASLKSLFPVATDGPAAAHNLFDSVDLFLTEKHGFTVEELDFIINYDIVYRMGREG